MAFCRFCGQKLRDGAQFCDSCGKKVITISDSNSRKELFEGTIHKCPNCGEIINAFVLNCPSCGFEFRDVSTSGSIRSFAEKIERIEIMRASATGEEITTADTQLISLITNFSVPNTREDLFEFVNIASSNIDISLLDNDIPDSNPRKAICKAWKSKLNQVYNKALMVFDENDPQFTKIQRLYEATQFRIRSQEKKQKIKFTAGLIFSLSSSVFAVILIVLGFITEAVGDSYDSTGAQVAIFFGVIILILNYSPLSGYSG